ncbi:MAG: DUF1640 domain-containing protein [Bradyrhizobiaceae bacterium]|nr:DUF1640 domain-containing protein [Bradyrhizobiaceae bacterium]
MNVLLDTLAIARGLREVGFSQQQAEALTDAVRSAAGLPDVSHLATKNDLQIVKSDLQIVKSDLQIAKSDLQITISEAKTEILKWVVGMILGSTLINVSTMIALVKLAGH